jgi:hypothetical protein
VSSQDEGVTGKVFQEPWTYEGSTEKAIRKLRDLVESMPGVRDTSTSLSTTHRCGATIDASPICRISLPL